MVAEGGLGVVVGGCDWSGSLGWVELRLEDGRRWKMVGVGDGGGGGQVGDA